MSWCKAQMKLYDITSHCFHEVEHEGKPSCVCCWCGDLFLSSHAENEHGKFLPNPATIVLRAAEDGRPLPENAGDKHHERACLCEVTPCPCECHRV